MATRQELLTGINLIRQICRLNKSMASIAGLMQYSKAYNPDKGIDDEGFKDFTEHKNEVTKLNNAMVGLSDRINVILTKVDSKYLDNGIDEIGMVDSRANIVSDNQTIKTMTTSAQSAIGLTSIRQDLADLAPPFQNYVSKSGIIEPDPWQMIETEANHANILQSVLNAMKYELQGLNENTGQAHGLDVKDIKKRVLSRIGVGWIYHGQLTSNPEPIGTLNKTGMGDVLSYIQQNLNSATSFIDLELLGQYINTYIPSVPSVRRGWAL